MDPSRDCAASDARDFETSWVSPRRCASRQTYLVDVTGRHHGPAEATNGRLAVLVLADGDLVRSGGRREKRSGTGRVGSIEIRKS